MIDCNEWRTEKRHECANMGKVKRLELWWQLYRTSLPVWDLDNFRPMDFYWHECTRKTSALNLGPEGRHCVGVFCGSTQPPQGQCLDTRQGVFTALLLKIRVFRGVIACEPGKSGHYFIWQPAPLFTHTVARDDRQRNARRSSSLPWVGVHII